jgi:hypothetical protein
MFLCKAGVAVRVADRIAAAAKATQIASHLFVQPDVLEARAVVDAVDQEQPRPATREVLLTEGRMVLYATQPKTLSPADPCNKVVVCGHSHQNGA